MSNVGSGIDRARDARSHRAHATGPASHATRHYFARHVRANGTPPRHARRVRVQQGRIYLRRAKKDASPVPYNKSDPSLFADRVWMSVLVARTRRHPTDCDLVTRRRAARQAGRASRAGRVARQRVDLDIPTPAPPCLTSPCPLLLPLARGLRPCIDCPGIRPRSAA